MSKNVHITVTQLSNNLRPTRKQTLNVVPNLNRIQNSMQEYSLGLITMWEFLGRAAHVTSAYEQRQVNWALHVETHQPHLVEAEVRPPPSPPAAARPPPPPAVEAATRPPSTLATGRPPPPAAEAATRPPSEVATRPPSTLATGRPPPPAEVATRPPSTLAAARPPPPAAEVATRPPTLAATRPLTPSVSQTAAAVRDHPYQHPGNMYLNITLKKLF